MKYNFETSMRRVGVGSFKWDSMLADNPNIGEDVIPLSVADMELFNPPEIIEGLKEYLDHIILGYTGATDAYYESVMNWMERRHGFRPRREWFVETAGVVPALNMLVAAYTKPEDAVMITTPVYYPFTGAVVNNHRELVENPLILKDDHYEIDFEDFEAKAKRPEVKLYILCSPHNPVGRIWTREELERISQICLENDVFIISDEIHFDLIMPGYQHVSMGVLDEKYVNNCAICTAPSKTFNLAGFQTSNIFIANKERRDKVESARGYHSLNIMGYKACELAYNRCEEWLEALLVHLDENRKLVEDFMAAYIPEVKVHRLEGTYLQWLDFRAFGLSKEELEVFMTKKAQWYTDEGYVFGEAGAGFERINLACTKTALEAALKRLLTAVEENLRK